jgi:hypothetical protein
VVITCPVCEHQQAAGSECEVCGRALAEGRGTDPPVPTLPELEATAYAPSAATGGPIPDLEVTRHAPADEAPPEPVPGLEATAAEAVGIPDLPPVEGLESTAASPADLPTLLPLAVTCRYCRTEAREGERICARCGMRLPVVGAAPAPAEAGSARPCPSCGTPSTGPRCLACGGRVAGG